MDRHAVLEAFDEQIRRRPPPGARVEAGEAVVRVAGGEDGWSGVTWSRLSEADADAAIAAAIDHFARLRIARWEWKHYSYDRPADLPRRLLAAGLTAEPPETLMVAEIARLALDVPPPPGVELRPVTDARGVEGVVRVLDEVFGEDHSALGRALLARLAHAPPTVAAVIAVADEGPVGTGRLELSPGTEFAGLWGDGTVPAWRGRGVFRSLVAHRAALAAAQGCRYLQVDAMPDSRPILERLGFVELATTTPFIHPDGS